MTFYIHIQLLHVTARSLIHHSLNILMPSMRAAIHLLLYSYKIKKIIFKMGKPWENALTLVAGWVKSKYWVKTTIHKEPFLDSPIFLLFEIFHDFAMTATWFLRIWSVHRIVLDSTTELLTCSARFSNWMTLAVSHCLLLAFLSFHHWCCIFLNRNSLPWVALAKPKVT